jgi:hypothetical protein
VQLTIRKERHEEWPRGGRQNLADIVRRVPRTAGVLESCRLVKHRHIQHLRCTGLTHSPECDLAREQGAQHTDDDLGLMPDGDGTEAEDDGNAQRSEDVPNCEQTVSARSTDTCESAHTFRNIDNLLARDLVQRVEVDGLRDDVEQHACTCHEVRQLSLDRQTIGYGDVADRVRLTMGQRHLRFPETIDQSKVMELRISQKATPTSTRANAAATPARRRVEFSGSVPLSQVIFRTCVEHHLRRVVPGRHDVG